MPELPDVVPGEAIQSTTFGNPVIRRVISRYADATQRDNGSPTPAAGEPAYLTASSELQVYDGTEWVTYATLAELQAAVDQIELDLALKVDKAGDTMTGALQVPAGTREDPGLVVGESGGVYKTGSSIVVTSELSTGYIMAVSNNNFQVVKGGVGQMSLNGFFAVQKAYDEVTAVAPNMNVNSGGAIRRSTSVVALQADLDTLEAQMVALQAQVDSL